LQRRDDLRERSQGHERRGHRTSQEHRYKKPGGSCQIRTQTSSTTEDRAVSRAQDLVQTQGPMTPPTETPMEQHGTQGSGGGIRRGRRDDRGKNIYRGGAASGASRGARIRELEFGWRGLGPARPYPRRLGTSRRAAWRAVSSSRGPRRTRVRRKPSQMTRHSRRRGAGLLESDPEREVLAPDRQRNPPAQCRSSRVLSARHIRGPQPASRAQREDLTDRGPAIAE